MQSASEELRKTLAGRAFNSEQLLSTGRNVECLALVRALLQMRAKALWWHRSGDS